MINEEVLGFLKSGSFIGGDVTPPLRKKEFLLINVLNYLYFTNSLFFWAPIYFPAVFSPEPEDCRLTSKRVICSSFDILPTRQGPIVTTTKGKLQGRNSDGRRQIG